MEVDKSDKGKRPLRYSPRRSESPQRDEDDYSMDSSCSASPYANPASDRIVPTAPAVVTTQLQNGGQSVSLAVASTSSAVIPYSMKHPNNEDLRSLQKIFPALEEAPMQVRDAIIKGTRIRFLTIWNFPAYLSSNGSLKYYLI